MISSDAEAVIDEINALRNDLVERGGINEELKKIRELLESINYQITLFRQKEISDQEK